VDVAPQKKKKRNLEGRKTNGVKRINIESSFGFLDSLPLKMGPIGCPEMSVNNYHYSPRNNPEQRISYLIRG